MRTRDVIRPQHRDACAWTCVLIRIDLLKCPSLCDGALGSGPGVDIELAHDGTGFFEQTSERGGCHRSTFGKCANRLKTHRMMMISAIT